MPIQLDFILRRLVVMAEHDQDLAHPPALAGRLHAGLRLVERRHHAALQRRRQRREELAAGVLTGFADVTVEEFEAGADQFLRTARHPTLDRNYLACSYAPMVELLDYLAVNGFRNYIVSGGGRDFMRPISHDVYGIPRQRVIGSGVSLAWQHDGSSGAIVRRAEADVLDDGPEKPVQIWNRIGRRPLLAAGNSNGDIPMLQFAEAPDRPSLRLLLRHDDAAREFDYVAGAEEALELAGTTTGPSSVSKTTGQRCSRRNSNSPRNPRGFAANRGIDA